ncbi:MAG TPA: hypothetical protein VM900_04280 [Sphingomonas sp.]|nr:hypothetical protein [Sphingomonas sp.]
MIRMLSAAIVAAQPATLPAPVTPPRVAGFAAALAEQPLAWGTKAWPQRSDAAGWAALAAATPSSRQATRWAMAQSLIGKTRAAEAIGVLDVMASDDPDLALVPAWRRARGVALAMLERPVEATAALADERLAADPESCLWRLRVALPASAVRDLGCAMPALATRPAPLRRPFLLAAAGAAIEARRVQPALGWLAALPASDGAANLLRAQALLTAGQGDRGRLLLARVIRSGRPGERAAAQLALVEAGLAAGTMTPAVALDRLADLRFAWRGDAVERQALALSVRLATDLGDGPAALAAGAVLFRYFDLGAEAGALVATMQQTLAAALASATQLPLPRAAGMFWDYRDLVPAGIDGDRLVEALAARLQRAGLYARAADLLGHRLSARAEDIEKGPLSVRVASLFILAGKPDHAIRVLRESEAIVYPAEMRADRRRVEAAALDLLGRSAEALATIQDVDDVAGLRAEILWRARDWPALAAAPAPPVPRNGRLTEVAQAVVLRHAIALAMLGREPELTVLNARYAAAFARLPTAATFAMLTGQVGTVEPDTLGCAMASLPAASPAGAIGDLIAAGDAALGKAAR